MVQPRGRLRRVAHRDHVDMMANQKSRIGVGVLVDADPDDRQIGEVVVQVFEPRSFLNAGGAPARPKIEHHHFAAVAGQVHQVSTVADGEIGGNLADLFGICSAVAAGQKRHGHQGKGNQPGNQEQTGAGHLLIIRSGRAGVKGRTSMGKYKADSAETSPPAEWKPILGLSDEPGERAEFPVRAGTLFDQPEPETLMELTVIVPARNEEDCIGACLESLVSQSEDVFKLGRDWELIVVDDESADRTSEIARGFAGVTVLRAGKLPQGWTGKANAVWTAARKARGRWLLFTDADTVHEPGNLHRAMHEAVRHKVGMLSYSPRQKVAGLVQGALMPLVFCELALAYPPAKVSDPSQRIAAANGQFLLVEREAYRRLGGHPAVHDKVLEDVELAFLAKRRKVGLRFRYADDAVATRMYRSTGAMIEGWTKNLALLFDNALALAVWRALDFVLIVGLPVVSIELWNAHFAAHSFTWLGAGWILALLWVRTLVRFYARVAKSNFPVLDCALTPLGLPLFVVLLYRSWFQHRILKQVSWKGRTYPG
jgi:glycosyltransferase involved in cell wall biosynthesis